MKKVEKPRYEPEDLVNHNGVSAIIKNKKGQVLVFTHNKFGFTTIPVGKCDSGEDFETAFFREVKEECNITPTKYSIIGERTFKYVREGNTVSIPVKFFEVAEFKGEVNNNEPHKHQNMRWATTDELMKEEYLSDVTLFFLEKEGFIRGRMLKNTNNNS